MRSLSDGQTYLVGGAALLLVFVAAALALSVYLGVELTARTFLGFAFGYLLNLGVYALAWYLYVSIDRREGSSEPGSRS